MPNRRILSLWFPRLAADHILRLEPGLASQPIAVVEQLGNAQHLRAVSAIAETAGAQKGMGLADARAVCPDLITRVAHPLREAAFLSALRRWAGRFTPWVAEEGAASLFLDITGCAHLLGGEEGLAEAIETDIARFALDLRIGIADTPGAAWGVARFGQGDTRPDRTGDAIDQEARATRSRAGKRKWIRQSAPVNAHAPRIIPPGQTRRALAPLPVAALRLQDDAIAGLNRLGLRTIGDLAALPRGSVARRFGLDVTRRLDQALGAEPEPISPAATEIAFACRLTFPDPIGLEADLQAGCDRLVEGLCVRLARAGRAARRVRLVLCRADGTWQMMEIGLARPSADPDAIRPLLTLKLREAEAGYGVDIMRLIAVQHEPHTAQQHSGHFEAAAEARARQSPGGGAEFEALMSRLGARVGLDAMTRLIPAESHIPEKAALIGAAAFSEAVPNWPAPTAPRPLTMFPPEPVTVLEPGRPPAAFRWRRRAFTLAAARGPERIAPEWWLDDPAWRSGPRDYWQVEAASGERLWLFEALGGDVPGGWFCGGDFG